MATIPPKTISILWLVATITAPTALISSTLYAVAFLLLSNLAGLAPGNTIPEHQNPFASLLNYGLLAATLLPAILTTPALINPQHGPHTRGISILNISLALAAATIFITATITGTNTINNHIDTLLRAQHHMQTKP